MEKDGRREGREKVGQTAAIQALNLLRPPPPLRCHWGEAKEVTHSYKHSINLPATLLVLDTAPAPLCLSASYAAVPLPSLCSRCQVTPPRAQRCRSTRCPFLNFFFPLPTLCQKCDGSQLRFMSVNHVKRSLWQGSWQNMTRLISVWETFSLFDCDDDVRLENHISIMEGTVLVKWTLAKVKWRKWTWAIP